MTHPPAHRIFGGAFAVLLLFATLASAQATGRIEGRVTKEGGGGVGGVTIVVTGTGMQGTTDRNGNYVLLGVPAGAHTLTFRLGAETVTESGVNVAAGQTTRLDKTVSWQVAFAETITVSSASRRVERVVEAPASVTIVDEDQIQREAAHGQLPKLLEFTPGAEVTQSGLYDYNFNTRGFNSSLNRRVATLIDGRNTSVPFLGAQEWAAISFPLDDLASVELIRGPSAALYGANASSGVLNMTTKEPRRSRGGQLRLVGGELSTANVDFRYAGGLGGDWFFKVTAGLRDSGDFTRSRNFNFMTGMGKAEYSKPCQFPPVPGEADCLPQEAVPLARENDNEIVFGSVRLDKDFGDGGLLTFEGGQANIEGPAFQTGIGRVQLVDIERPWARINYSRPHWNFLASYTGRDAPKQLALSAGTNLALDTERLSFEVQTNWEFAQGQRRLVVGASHAEEDIDSFDPDRPASQGGPGQTLVFAPIQADQQAVFGQFDQWFGEHVKLVLAGRWDQSDLHRDQFSPKATFVIRPTPDHSIRLTYNEAFQVANYSEFFLQANAAPPADLSMLEGLCLLSGVTDCGLAAPVPVLALGNKDLQLEEVETIEVGYTGILANKAFLTFDFYTSENRNFITDLLPNLGTSLGRVNPNFGAWVGSTAAETNPCALNPLVTVADCIRGSVPLLSNNVDGANIIAAVSYTNFGKVDTQGADFGLNLYFKDDWRWSMAYSWFDFDIKNQLPGFASLLLPNSPENKGSAGLAYIGDRIDVSGNVRWVDDFRWGVGPFQGNVESYTTVDFNGNFKINDLVTVGINVANLFDDGHWESFGGDILERRALGHVVLSWGEDN